MNIWVNGCFDIIHTGHLELLWYAKMFPYGVDSDKIFEVGENKLYVGIDTDDRVKRLKGSKRPINDVNTRLTILSNLQMVDDVFIFDTDEELRELVKKLSIDYMVVGDQYRNKEVIGSENSKLGVEFYPVDKRSTTGIIEKLIKEGKLQVHEEMYTKFKDVKIIVGEDFNKYLENEVRKIIS